MPLTKHLLPWVEKLTGLDGDRVLRNCAVIAGWQVEGISERLAAPTNLDDAVRATLLVDAVNDLVSRGAPQSKLLSKLRDVAQFEATWAEIRCAAVIANNADSDVRVELEAGRSAGRQPDLRLLIPEGLHTSVEIKAVGASETEAEFMRRVAPALDTVIPRHGMVTLHAPWDIKRAPRWTPENVAVTRRDSARAAASTPGYPVGLSAAAIVAHGSEPQYIRRAVDRINRAIKQLPTADECWVALHWSNGAPIDDVAEALDWTSIPSHVVGVVFVGSVVAFPHRDINNFQVMVARGYQAGGEMDVESSVSDNFARLVLSRTESTAGIRATLVRGVINGKSKQVLRRDGSERIAPFNLVLDRDPLGRTHPGI
jgi:hypothetical protein